MGITGIGEGGSKDTLEQCAGTLIGKDPFKIEAIWQEMYIAWFYPPGREKTHAMGAMDLALWDIKGKALKLPVHELLGGTVRNYCECYGTTFMPSSAGEARHAARSRAGGDGRGVSRFPHGRRRRADRRRLQQPRGCQPRHRAVQGSPRGRRTDRRLVHRLPPALRPQRRRARLPRDRGIPAVLRRGPRARRARAHGPAEAPPDDDRATHPRRRVGQPLGLQQARGEPRHRLHPRDAPQCRRHHRDDEDRGDL